jgi:putative membrane protein
MRWVQGLLAVAGGALFVVLVMEIGVDAIASSFATLSWRLALIVVFPFVAVTLFDTLGWVFAFRRRVPFWALVRARMAGESFNATTPTASVGGEAVKAWLLWPSVPVAESLASVIVAKTTITIAQGLFLLFGILCALPVLAPESRLLNAMKWGLGLEAVLVGLFVAAQLAGMFEWCGRLLARAGLGGAAVSLGSGRRLDDALAVFYRREPRRLTLSITFHFFGWLTSGLEAYLILFLLGVPVPLLTALVIEAVGTGVRFATFFVPAHLGALESGYVAAFPALGLHAGTGLAFSLVRRVREAAWIGLGFLLLTLSRERMRAAHAAHAHHDSGAGGG